MTKLTVASYGGHRPRTLHGSNIHEVFQRLKEEILKDPNFYDFDNYVKITHDDPVGTFIAVSHKREADELHKEITAQLSSWQLYKATPKPEVCYRKMHADKIIDEAFHLEEEPLDGEESYEMFDDL